MYTVFGIPRPFCPRSFSGTFERCHICILDFCLIYVYRFRNVPGRRFHPCLFLVRTSYYIYVRPLSHLHSWFLYLCKSFSARPPRQEVPPLLSFSATNYTYYTLSHSRAWFCLIYVDRFRNVPRQDVAPFWSFSGTYIYNFTSCLLTCLIVACDLLDRFWNILLGRRFHPCLQRINTYHSMDCFTLSWGYNRVVFVLVAINLYCFMGFPTGFGISHRFNFFNKIYIRVLDMDIAQHHQ